MKRSITATGLLSLVAMMLVGVFSTGSALAGGGPNSTFSWTGPLPGLILALSVNSQVFEAAAGTDIVCAHFRGHGIASNGKAMTTKEVTIRGVYTSCLAVKGSFGASVTPAEYLIGADGSVGVITTPIVVTIPGLNCSLKINNGAPNNNLRLLLYLNQATDILAHIEAKNITSLVFGGGGVCGEEGQEKTEGTYRGLLLVSVDGGTLHWNP
jgi:hypothetical protein